MLLTTPALSLCLLALPVLAAPGPAPSPVGGFKAVTKAIKNLGKKSEPERAGYQHMSESSHTQPAGPSHQAAGPSNAPAPQQQRQPRREPAPSGSGHQELHLPSPYSRRVAERPSDHPSRRTRDADIDESAKRLLEVRKQYPPSVARPMHPAAGQRTTPPTHLPKQASTYTTSPNSPNSVEIHTYGNVPKPITTDTTRAYLGGGRHAENAMVHALRLGMPEEGPNAEAGRRLALAKGKEANVRTETPKREEGGHVILHADERIYGRKTSFDVPKEDGSGGFVDRVHLWEHGV